MDKAEKEKLRNKELKKLDNIFKHLPKDKHQLAEGLKSQAAFMFATLAELQEIINNEGAVDLFEQGKQSMIRESPASKTYNAMIKNYNTVCKQLFDLLGDDKKAPGASAEEQEFIAFIKGGSK